MTDTRTQRLQQMQDELDTLENAEARRALRSQLSDDPELMTQFEKLERVDRMLASAPRERAPERLAAKIMARVSAIMKQQKSEKWPVPQEAIAAAMMLANTATLPLMTGAAWLLIHAASQPRMFETVLPRVVAIHLAVIEVMVEVLRQAETVATDDPETAAAIIALLPDALRAMAEGLKDEE